ncbi:hypothetical protein QBC37DRAFT_403841 [Rhypophila decipiens]|uniref:Uncharacterized protein n=1 Tax=Rhypophila decipiens TaxID=261697 RepID=A0AAN6Y2E4_9PEZI|nr:hypothetical protein QBC37DRAFT_403841 [Rhypophila decipiens]
MGIGLTSGIVVAIARVALAATVTTTCGLANPVTVAPYVQFVAGTTIQTIVTVNFNEIHVIAAEGDAPKTIEKLQELCSSPLAPLYPEICDNVEEGSTVEDLDLGESTGVGELLSEVSSASTYGAAWAVETGSATSGNIKLSDLPEYIPEASKIVSTLTVPVDSTTTMTTTMTATTTITLEDEDDEATSLPLTIAHDGKINKTYSNDPTTFETRIKSTLASVDEGSHTTDRVPLSDLIWEEQEPATLASPTPSPDRVPLSDIIYEEPAALANPTPGSTAIFGAPWDSGNTYGEAGADGRCESDNFSIATFSAVEEPTPIPDKSVEPGLLLRCLRETDKGEEGPKPSETSATMIICYTTPTTDSLSVFTFTLSPQPSSSHTLAHSPTPVRQSLHDHRLIHNHNGE